MAAIPAAQLARLSLFQGMSGDDLNAIAGACTDASYAAGQTILQEGEVSRALWLLLDGTAEVDLEVPKAGERVIAELNAPSIFGESSFFHSHPHSATVKSRTATRLLRLDRTRFDQLVSENNVAALRLGVKAAEILAGRLFQTDRFVEKILESQMDVKIHTAWRHLRDGLGQSTEGAGPFVGLGANWS
jgi:CRP/FNR family transcriptional regulator, cyclic AMP receptor protein